MIYRIEIHQTETGKYLPQVWDGYADRGDPLWEGQYYEDMDDAYTAARYEFDQRMEVDREAAVLARLGPDDRPGESEKD